jgi:hypothetical protein
MKFGIRKPSIQKRIAARTSGKRFVGQIIGLKAPRGYGWLANHKKAAYNRGYKRTTKGCETHIMMIFSVFIIIVTMII